MYRPEIESFITKAKQNRKNLFIKLKPAKYNPPPENGNANNNNNFEKKSLQRTESLVWWEPSEDNLAMEFFRNTSLHGLRYVGQEKRHICERIFWFFAFLVGIVTATFLIYGVFDKYTNNPIIISFLKSETTVFQIPFPAVTICNVNNVKKTTVEEYHRKALGNPEDESTQEALKQLYYVNQVCSAESRSFTSKFGFTTEGSTISKELLAKTKLDEDENQQNDVKTFLREAAQSCDEMILLCLWEGFPVNCTELFNEIETDYGKCCTFNMVPKSLLHRFENDSRDSPEVIEKWRKADLSLDSLLLPSDDVEYSDIPMFPRRIRRAGKPYGLSILVNPGLDEYYCTNSDSTGFQLVTHLPIEIPQAADYGMGIPPNSEVFVDVFPDVTTAESEVLGFDVEKRDCYFHNEYSLQYYSYYTVANCIDECIANLVYSKCECVLYHMPRDDSRNLCSPSKFHCTDEITRSFSSTGFKRYCSKCLPTCTQIAYLTQSSVTPMRDANMWISTTDYKIANWSTSNVSIVHVYFGHDSVYPKVRKSLYGFVELIANTGGLLGLCLGFSALSAMEFIYFLTIRACCKKRLRKHIKHQLTSRLHLDGLKRSVNNQSQQTNKPSAIPTSTTARKLRSNSVNINNITNSRDSLRRMSHPVLWPLSQSQQPPIISVSAPTPPDEIKFMTAYSRTTTPKLEISERDFVHLLERDSKSRDELIFHLV